VIPKVVFLNPWDRLIGPNRYLIEVLRNLPDLARNSTVVFDQANGAEEEYQDIGCSVEVWPEIAPIHPRVDLGNAVKMLKVHTVGLARVAKRLRSICPDAAVSNTENLWIGGMASRIIGVPHLQLFHAMTFKDRLGGRPAIMKAYLRFLSLWSRSFIAVSGAVASALEAGGVDPACIARVPNPMHTNLGIATNGEELAGPASVERPDCWSEHLRGRPVIVCAGRISPMKGQDLLVSALPEVRDKFPDLECVFAGRIGSDLGLDDTTRFHCELLRQIVELRLESNVTFLGELDNLPSLLARADVYVQPSRTESFGRVVCESLISGTPVAGFAVGGIPEASGPGALLAPPGDVAALSQAIIRILENSDLAQELAVKGRAYVERNFEAGEIAARFFEVIAAASPTTQLQERPAWTQS
jgi:glycosyltransferase involved in cell wall biosynthesis